MDNDFNYEEEYKKLTERQKRFIDYYIETGNSAKASKMAGYKGKTDKAMGNIGSENLEKLGKFINYNLNKKSKDRIASQDEVLEFLTRVARGDEPRCDYARQN